MKEDGKRRQMSETTAVMLLLTVSGGLQDAYSYFVRGRVFANAQTGNIVLMAVHFFTGEFFAGLRYLVPVLFFMAGIFVAEQIEARCRLSGKFHWRHVVLGLEMGLLLVVGFLPISAWMNPIANALTSFSCAMQVQAFRKVNGHAYASTMCIGNMRSGTEALSAFLRSGEPGALKRAGQYFFVIATFFTGAGIGGVLARNLSGHGGRIIFLSVALLLGSFLLMLWEEKSEEEGERDGRENAKLE